MSANLKRRCGILLGAAFIILSILALLPEADVDHDAGYISSELSIRETADGNVTSTSYVNPDGVITDAIDIGYATVCRMRDDNDRVVEERYLDASGNPVARYGDYYGLSYEYDETGLLEYAYWGRSFAGITEVDKYHFNHDDEGRIVSYDFFRKDGSLVTYEVPKSRQRKI